MLIQSISTQPLTRATQPANRDGFILSASFIRSGNLSIEADSPPSLATDTVQLLDSNIAQQIETFIVNATGTPKELESQFLASVLGQHLQEAKNIGETEAVKAKLLAYLQANNLDGAFRLLNGSHQPLKHEFNGKYNLFKWMQNTMQASMQAQPIHDGLPPELATFEAFEKHVKDLRRQVRSCLGVVEPPKGGALIPKTKQDIAAAIEKTTGQLQAITKQMTDLASLEHDDLLKAAIKNYVQASPDSAEVLTRARLRDWLEQVKNTTTAEGNSLLEIHEVQQYLQGLLLSLGGGKSSIEEQLALKAVIAQLAPAASIGDPILAPVPQRFVDGVGALVTNAHAISRVNMGLSEDLLAQLPPELRSVKALKTAMGTFQQGLLTGSQEALDFAKSQVVSPQAKEGLIQAYRLWLGQQAGQLAERLDQLENLPIVELPAFLQKLPKATQHQLEAVIENILTLPPVEGMRQLKVFISEIPQDMRGALEQFIASEHQRLANMRTVEANVQKQLARQVAQTVEMIGSEVFNPAEISRQVNNFTTEMMPALQAEVVAPVAQLSEVITSIPARVQSGAEAVKAQILAELNARVVEPIQKATGQVTKVIKKTTDTIEKAVQTAVGNPAKTGDGATTPVVIDKLPLPVSDSDGITFAQPLKVVEAQGEKVGWFPALMEQNKAWLPWVIGGTLSLGLLAWLGTRLSKKRPSVGEGEAS